MNLVQSKTEPETLAFETYHQQGFMEITPGQTTANKFQSVMPWEKHGIGYLEHSYLRTLGQGQIATYKFQYVPNSER